MAGKFTAASCAEAKRDHRKITMLTAYDYSMARLLDESGIDAILVGDSLGMTMQGGDTTLGVTLDQMVYHCKCVTRGVKRALVVGDMPFLTYHVSREEAVRNAGRLVQEAGVGAIKLEGGAAMADTVRAIVRAQIPVMGHIGLTPQSVNVFGGFKIQGREERKARQLLDDALALEEAGVFAMVLEGVPQALARLITERVSVPTIGIGAGKYCDGQVLVVHDMLGMYSDFTPKFVKQYARLSEAITQAVTGYIGEVREGCFPQPQHTFSMDEEVLEQLYGKTGEVS